MELVTYVHFFKQDKVKLSRTNTYQNVMDISKAVFYLQYIYIITAAGSFGLWSLGYVLEKRRYKNAGLDFMDAIEMIKKELAMQGEGEKNRK